LSIVTMRPHWLSWAAPFALIAMWAEWLVMRCGEYLPVVGLAGALAGCLGAFLSRFTRGPIGVTTLATLFAGVVGGVIFRGMVPWHLSLVRGAVGGFLLSIALLPAALVMVLALARAHRAGRGSVVGAMYARTPWAIAALLVALVSLDALGNAPHFAPPLACMLAGLVALRVLALDLRASRLLACLLADLPRCVEADGVEAERVLRVGVGSATFVKRGAGETAFRNAPTVELAIVGDVLAGWQAARSAVIADGLMIAAIIFAASLHVARWW
jgi:hypothetical protein